MDSIESVVGWNLFRKCMYVQFVLQYSSVKNIIVNQEPANIHEVSLLKVCSILLNIDSILNRNIRDNFQQEEKKRKKRGKLIAGALRENARGKHRII